LLCATAGRKIRICNHGFPDNTMRSNKSTLLLSFGVLFLAFGSVMLVLDFLGLHFGAREAMSRSSLLAVVFVVLGAALYGGGFAIGKRDRAP
jgi:multisubunit Na+/H+ antiporter MnhG subunit